VGLFFLPLSAAGLFMTKLQRKHQSSVSSSSSFSSGDTSNDSDAFDPHDVNFPRGVHFYEHEQSVLDRPDSVLLPPGLQHDNYDEFAEKVPLTVGENFSYPSRYVVIYAGGQAPRLISCAPPRLITSSPVSDTPGMVPPRPRFSMAGSPMHRDSVVSLNTDWRRRQTVKRGVTRRVKLTNGNFIAEYAVPTAVHNAIESKYSATKSTEFSSVAAAPQDFAV